jgi:hypothetical protein
MKTYDIELQRLNAVRHGNNEVPIEIRLPAGRFYAARGC